MTPTPSGRRKEGVVAPAPRKGCRRQQGTGGLGQGGLLSALVSLTLGPPAARSQRNGAGGEARWAQHVPRCAEG